MTATVLPFRPRATAWPKADPRNGSLVVTHGAENGLWWVDHHSWSGDSIGFIAGPFDSRAKAMAAARGLAAEWGCEVAG
jgi:hypothetical protein